MQIQSINKNQIYYKKSVPPSFKQIKPEHLFINSAGYEKNQYWARECINIIEDSVNNIKTSKVSFKSLIDYIADQYRNSMQSSIFGQERFCYGKTMINGRYDVYKNRLLKLVKTKKTKYIDDFNYCEGEVQAKIHTSQIVSTVNGKKIKLNEVRLLELEFPREYSCLELSAPPVSTIKCVFDEIKPIYKRILNNNDSLTDKNITTITQDIAKIHWLLSQARPYMRGSAGVADIVAKTLFEAKGIQVSAYKKDVNPNMEAFVMGLDEYVKKYKDFFTEPLRPITNN